MSSIIIYPYNSSVIESVRQWHYGTNWPVVYIVYNSDSAYVGETLDARRRTEQHLQEESFASFTNICFISDKYYNKSVILDLESYLIKYMSADPARKLTNSNRGIIDHDYFYREAYEDDFKDIWNELLARGIVSKSVIEIENSELFKYSPYKSLSDDQQKAAYDILKRISEINNASQNSLINVLGGAGTGKTILAVFLMKLLADINNHRAIIEFIDDNEETEAIRRIIARLTNIKKAGFVVPQSKLRTVMKNVFNSIDGLSKSMILAPEDVVSDMYDVLIVDEAHRLYKRHDLSSPTAYKKFDKINQELMGDAFTGTEKDYTELDWIIKSSRIQVLFYDELQRIRSSDISTERFESICKPHLYKYYTLVSQMRCKGIDGNGGNGYYEYIKEVLETANLQLKNYKKIEGYEVKVVDQIDELFSKIRTLSIQNGLSRVVCGPGWTKDENLIIEGKSFQWAGDKDEISQVSDRILSIHKCQGFDLNYAGVIFGKEIYYDNKAKRIEVNKKELGDPKAKSEGPEAMRQFILNVYLTLMTRGIKGTFVYAVDDTLREYLRTFLE